MYNKITTGFVIQTYNDEGECVSQEFIAGDQVDYENEEGEPIAPPYIIEEYQEMVMVQPM